MVDASHVTHDEILAIYDDAPGTVWSLQQLAERIWRKRGGEGAYLGAARLRSPDVPLVGPHAIRGPLTELCQTKILTSAVGDEATTLGHVSEGPRPGIRYYGLATTATRLSADADIEEAFDIVAPPNQTPQTPMPQQITPVHHAAQRASGLLFSHKTRDATAER
ncbi:MAG: hypothetical protein M3451_04975 [Chloroflexota bacterium]|nr:hypothetical protein [Chloroflexota bacterium]